MSFLQSARVGGIMDNATHAADYIRDNLRIQTNLIDSSYKVGTKKLLFLGSSCIYPKHANQPMTEDQLLLVILNPLINHMLWQRLLAFRCVSHIISSMDLMLSL